MADQDTGQNPPPLGGGEPATRPKIKKLGLWVWQTLRNWRTWRNIALFVTEPIWCPVRSACNYFAEIAPQHPVDARRKLAKIRLRKAEYIAEVVRAETQRQDTRAANLWEEFKKIEEREAQCLEEEQYTNEALEASSLDTLFATLFASAALVFALTLHAHDSDSGALGIILFLGPAISAYLIHGVASFVQCPSRSLRGFFWFLSVWFTTSSIFMLVVITWNLSGS